MQRSVLLYFHSGYSSFIKKDIQILQKKYDVRIFHFQLFPKKRTVFSFIEQLLFLCKHLYYAKCIVCQFAGYHTILPVVLGRALGVKSLIITGGTESVSFPSINYGNYRKMVLGFFTKWSLKLCSHISPVHESLVHYNYDYQNADYPTQGIRYHIKNLTTPITVIYNGYESHIWKQSPDVIKKEKTFITVAGGIDNPMRYVLKGVDLIMEVAKYFSDCTFIIIGFKQTPDNLQMPPNVKLLNYVENERLPQIFAEQQFYLQLSISEGFPNALCEAMLCGCVPIGSAVGAIPDIIDDTGFLLQKRDIEQLKMLIISALQANVAEMSFAARSRIENEFPLQRRENKLLALLEKLI